MAAMRTPTPVFYLKLIIYARLGCVITVVFVASDIALRSLFFFSIVVIGVVCV